MTVVAYIGLGANLGEAVQTVSAALVALDQLPGTRLSAASRLYRTAAWGRQEQPAFVNAVAAVVTSLAPLALLEQLLALELVHGRQRLPGERWGPRTLDLDLLLYADRVIDLPNLQVPHPHLHERAFALVPLAEIAPDTVIAGHGAVRNILDGMEVCDVAPIG